MGMTGSGKSSVRISAFVCIHTTNTRCSLHKQFIKHITGDEGIKIASNLSSQTPEINVHYWSAPDGRRVALVDTPGFDDSNGLGLSDSDVLDAIASYLKGK
jgi:predicted GTPase